MEIFRLMQTIFVGSGKEHGDRNAKRSDLRNEPQPTKKAHQKVRLLETCTYTLSAKYLMVLTIWLV